jgi:hypothetical protein
MRGAPLSPDANHLFWVGTGGWQTQHDTSSDRTPFAPRIDPAIARL